MTRKRVLVAHPYVYSRGGGNAVAAWALQALRDEFEVTLATLGPVDCDAVNRNFGTCLGDGDFRVEIAPWRYRAPLRAMPTPGALLEACVTMRWAQDLDTRCRFDCLLSTQNEADFGRPGLQYVHFPWVYLPRPENELRWFHHIPGLLRLYRGSCRRLARSSNEGLRRNLFLANSRFVAGKIRETHGVESIILNPPVPGEFPNIPWKDRRRAVVSVGRMNGCKRWELAVDIVDRVRRLGVDLGLTIIAHHDDPEYGRRIAALAESRPWFRIRNDLSRQELAREVASHRYGLHTMENEHFGIAVAELLRAGCIPFVHGSGGPLEIVEGRPELCSQDAAEAAEKIRAVACDHQLESGLVRLLGSRREEYSTRRFESQLRALVGEACSAEWAGGAAVLAGGSVVS